MKNAIIIHGTCDKEEYYSPEYPSASNFHWLPWLVKQLLIKDIHAVTPEMPHGYMPDYTVWKREFERFDITNETILVGHSCGGGFLVRWLSENKDKKVGKVVLVAPWLDPNKTKGEDNDFFDFIMDPELVSRTQGVTVFNSDDDMEAVHKSVKQIMDTIPNIKLVGFEGKGHFCLSDLGTEAFPELLEEILG
ncbi:alpha/beta hydrolase [Candidatus Kaiserbacteria bacterium]|nr:alpha/beta hydrolase [Candidatus Kaiserbacteria bacterium]